jgi:hypothetical protein
MTAIELSQTNDEAEARRKVISAGITPGMVQDLINNNPQIEPQLSRLKTIAENNSSAANTQADKIKRGGFQSLVLGPIGCILGTILIGIILAFVFTFYWAVPVGKWAKGDSAGTGVHAERMAAQKAMADQKTDFGAAGEAPPISQYMSTYILGDDLYDDSFSIETPSGDFLGECGSGISETIGVGDPKKVSATEVWLFDKTDIRTVTKVLMSEHAYNDPAIRAKLAPKGEAVLIQPGSTTVLETQALRVQVRIIDLQYGEGSLPPKSFFSRLTVEIAAWPKEGAVAAAKPADSSAFGDTAELLNY